MSTFGPVVNADGQVVVTTDGKVLMASKTAGDCCCGPCSDCDVLHPTCSACDPDNAPPCIRVEVGDTLGLCSTIGVYLVPWVSNCVYGLVLEDGSITLTFDGTNCTIEACGQEIIVGDACIYNGVGSAGTITVTYRGCPPISQCPPCDDQYDITYTLSVSYESFGGCDCPGDIAGDSTVGVLSADGCLWLGDGFQAQYATPEGGTAGTGLSYTYLPGSVDLFIPIGSVDGCPPGDYGTATGTYHDICSPFDDPDVYCLVTVTITAAVSIIP